MSPQAARIMLISLAFATGLMSVFAVIVIVTGRTSAPIIPTASAIGGPFQLTSHDGNQISDADLKGKPHLIFFGFTHCPDVCPTALFEVSEVLRALGPDGDKARALFVTVDPERDTAPVLKDYLSNFDPRLIGVTGSIEDVGKMLSAYRVYFKKVPTEGGNYTMDHTALVYLMDKQGRFVAPFNLKRRPEEAAADLRRYL
jgi:protein SCO1/2